MELKFADRMDLFKEGIFTTLANIKKERIKELIIQGGLNRRMWKRSERIARNVGTKWIRKPLLIFMNPKAGW